MDATTSHERFSFIVSFSCYNQIRMVPGDEEKIVFKTPVRNFFYVVMLFDHKNAGAMYQRTMTAIFHDMMHDFIEDYVDNLVVKSKLKEQI